MICELLLAHLHDERLYNGYLSERGERRNYFVIRPSPKPLILQVQQAWTKAGIENSIMMRLGNGL